MRCAIDSSRSTDEVPIPATIPRCQEAARPGDAEGEWFIVSANSRSTTTYGNSSWARPSCTSPRRRSSSWRSSSRIEPRRLQSGAAAVSVAVDVRRGDEPRRPRRRNPPRASRFGVRPGVRPNGLRVRVPLCWRGHGWRAGHSLGIASGEALRRSCKSRNRVDGGPNVIGREPDATIQIDARGVSRHHARILVSHGDATLEDLGSKNGTRINGHRIATPAPLADSDEIELGTVGLTFRIASSTSPTETVPTRGA